MPVYRKKPVEIEARRFIPFENDETCKSQNSLIDWCGGEAIDDAVDGMCMLIDTLEGKMKAKEGDWVIRGIHGEFYPCKHEIFIATYNYVRG